MSIIDDGELFDSYDREDYEDDAVEIKGVITRSTEMAVEIYVNGVSAWLPKSQIYEKHRKGETDVLYIPHWLAEEKELV